MIFGTRLLIERVEALVHHRDCPLLALRGHLYRTWLLSDAKRTRGVSVLTVIGWALMTRANSGNSCRCHDFRLRLARAF